MFDKFFRKVNSEDELMHYGVSKEDGAPGPGSGRYPKGSGENPNQHTGDFKTRVDKLRKEGAIYVDPKTGKEYKGDTAIAYILGMTTTQFRAQYSLAKDEDREKRVSTARRLREEGYSLNEIAKKMGYNNDSSVRTLLNEGSEARMNAAKTHADFMKEIVDKNDMPLDVGKGVERELGCSREKMNEALEILKMQGYNVYGRGVAQVTNHGKQTNVQWLCPPGMEHKDVYNINPADVNTVKEYDYILDENDKKRPAFQYPASLDPKRLQIRYAEDGGIDKDGLVEIRPGVEDISLGESNYAQVRILVNGTHYIKGMAVYNDDMPEGTDIIFNTNKSKSVPVMGPKDNSVLKPISKDPTNPFNSLIKEHGGQSYYISENGEEKLRLINKRAEEGDWGEWADKLPSQFLSKQPLQTIDKQLDLTYADKKAEYDEIMALTNPTVKKALLKSFADDCDSAAVHLKAAAMPRQKYQVILPLTTLKDNECYAPNYKDGSTLYLIRYPHGGTFEIPVVKVNNKNKEGQKFITPNAKDAIGINKNVADRLSGADFDGDTVMVIPQTRSVKILSTPPLKELEGFDPKMEYPYREGMKLMKNTQIEMGIISNLITDMTIKGADEKEIARAVKHSMVVIDAEKHRLDYKRSEEVNGIAALKRKYQGHIAEDGKYHEGAGTLISRAKSQQPVVKRKGSGHINQQGKPWYDPSKPEGAMVWDTVPNATYPYRKKVKDPKTGEYLKDPATGNYIWEDTGKTKTRTQKSTKMAEATDARDLISDFDHPKERAYAEYANKLKALANQSRIDYLNAGNVKYDSNANKIYKEQVDHLLSQLNVAKKMAPRERKAQYLATSVVEAKKQANPDMTKSEIKKAEQMAITEARKQVGSKHISIDISDKEWEAIQAGAISENRLKEILDHTDTDKIKKLATPKTHNTISAGKQSLIKALKNSGYTNAEIAERLQLSTSTISKYL